MNRRQFMNDLIHLTLGMTFFSKYASANDGNQNIPTWKELIEYARWCPSVHNLQPQRIKIVNHCEAELFYDPSRLLPHGDKHSIFATVAMGIFVENLSIAAAKYNYQVSVIETFGNIDHSKKELTKFATIKILKRDLKESLDRDLILKRRTSRIQYDGKLIHPKILTELENESSEHGYRFESSKNPKLIDFLIAKNEETLFEDLESENMRTELNQLFRYTKHEASQKKDGLWSRCMGFPGMLMKSVFNHHKTYNYEPLRNLISNYYSNSFEGTKTLGWIVGDFSHVAHWLDAGRLIARIWLILTKHGAYIQPFGSLLTNEKMYTELCQKLEIKSTENICMIFRIGYSKTPTRSYRLDTDQLILNK